MHVSTYPLCALLMGLGLLGGQAVAAPTPAPLDAVSPVTTCASLVHADLAQDVGAVVHIASAEEGTIEGARYCQVDGVIDGRIRFELRLPVTGWTQRYVQVGCGGLCGVLEVRLEHADDCRPAQDHALALASSDMGHSGRSMGDGSFGKDPQARIDFAYRGVHLTAVAAQRLIREYYGRRAKFAYFSGCSDGGREAMMEAERFPRDFDGIAAGAPAMNFQVQNSFYHAWMYAANHRSDGTAILTAAKLPALHAAALASCDALDGVKDGVIVDPRACHFDPADAECRSGQAPNDQCLTAEEVTVARKFYGGPRDAAGHRFTIGGPQVGSELAWRDVYVPESAAGVVMSQEAALGTLRYLAFAKNPGANYSLNDFHFDQATFQQLQALHPLYDATDTDLSRFESRGGKLILWHGWSDPHISPINTIAYYQAVRRFLGAPRTARFLRLFLFPGMYHCSGGDGFGAFDVLTPLMSWVEGGAAPDRIIAGHVAIEVPPEPPPTNKAGRMIPPPPAGGPHGMMPVTRTRPVFSYPAVPKYYGTGSIDEAASYVAGAPLNVEPAAYDWEGAMFMAPGFHKDCSMNEGRLVCR